LLSWLCFFLLMPSFLWSLLLRQLLAIQISINTQSISQPPSISVLLYCMKYFSIHNLPSVSIHRFTTPNWLVILWPTNKHNWVRSYYSVISIMFRVL
jgi:hypothetical protein